MSTLTANVLSDDVLDKMMLLFWERGYSRTSIHDLIAVTGINRASLYKNFGGKRGLFLAMLQRFRGMVVIEATISISDPAFGMEGLKNFFMQFVHCSRDVVSSHGCLMLATAANLPQHEPEVIGMIDEFISHLRALFYKNLRWQQAEKYLDKDLNTEMTSDFLVGNVVGLMTLMRSAADPHLIENHVKNIMLFLSSMPMHKTAAQGHLHLIS